MPTAIDHVLRHGASGETYNVPGGVEMANRDVVRAPPRATRQAVVARPSRRGPARTRPTLRDGWLEAGRARLATRDVVRGGARPDTSTGSSPTSPGGGPRAQATGTPTTSASTDRGCGPPADAGRRHRRRRSARTRAGRGAGRGAVHGSSRPDRVDPGRLRPRCARRRRGRARPRSAGGRRPHGGLDRRGRLRPRP